MFTQIWNTSIGWGYVYQWWLSALMYYLLIKNEPIHLSWEPDFNKNIDWLSKHFWWSLWSSKIESRDLYLEWYEKSFEDINYLRKTSWWVWYGFVQAKTMRDSDDTYTKMPQLEKIIKKFYDNEHFNEWNKCAFVIASNVEINTAHKKLIKDNSIEFKLNFLKKVILEKEFYNAVDSPQLIFAIEETNNDIISKIIDGYWEITAINFIESYNRLFTILDKIYFFDRISPKNILSSIDSIKKTFKKEEILFHTIYKATRRKIPDTSDDDFNIFDQYPTTKFWWNTKTDIIEWGFLLLDT